jgi:hypothetical protein
LRLDPLLGINAVLPQERSLTGLSGRSSSSELRLPSAVFSAPMFVPQELPLTSWIFFSSERRNVRV